MKNRNTTVSNSLGTEGIGLGQSHRYPSFHDERQVDWEDQILMWLAGRQMLGHNTLTHRMSLHAKAQASSRLGYSFRFQDANTHAHTRALSLSHTHIHTHTTLFLTDTSGMTGSSSSFSMNWSTDRLRICICIMYNVCIHTCMYTLYIIHIHIINHATLAPFLYAYACPRSFRASVTLRTAWNAVHYELSFRISVKYIQHFLKFLIFYFCFFRIFFFFFFFNIRIYLKIL